MDGRMGITTEMASDVLCGHCGAVLTNPSAPCPRCGAPASGAWYYSRPQARKDPRIAALLAVIPGMGHFYLGHNMKGIGYLVGVLGLQFFGLAVGVPMELGGGTLWAYSIVDAYRTAKHMEGPAPGANYRA